jgi:dipeptidyl aminopeptidase/acylaminoacyl peptidase
MGNKGGFTLLAVKSSSSYHSSEGPLGSARKISWGPRWFNISIPLLASQGIAVFEPNVRGSDGYGLEFRQSIYKDWGGKPFKDLMTGIDAIIEKGVADPERLVISGWSYGGYLTAWAIGHTSIYSCHIRGLLLI